MSEHEVHLPAELAEAVRTARLPENYENAILALAVCERLDECREWADQAGAR